jgi:Rieske Fe-S protein
MPEISRRDFLKITRDGLLYLSGALTLGGLLRFLSYQSEPALQTEFDLGPADNFVLDTQTILPDIPAILLRSEKGFTALSLICTHLGCTVGQSTNGFACPCHGSQFDSHGNVLHGPATQKLQSLRVEQMLDGHLHLFKN